VETALGIDSINDIAAQAVGARLFLGNLDLAVDLGIDQLRDDEPGLLYARSRLVIASAMYGLPSPVDGVYPHLNDPDGLARSVQRGRELGFAAKLCIHPRQIEVVVKELSPTSTEIDWAERVVQVEQSVQGKATQDNGEMLDVPQYRRAARILANANRKHS
jgi:citrate lyase beta subunit